MKLTIKTPVKKLIRIHLNFTQNSLHPYFNGFCKFKSTLKSTIWNILTSNKTIIVTKYWKKKQFFLTKLLQNYFKMLQNCKHYFRSEFRVNWNDTRISFSHGNKFSINFEIFSFILSTSNFRPREHARIKNDSIKKKLYKNIFLMN